MSYLVSFVTFCFLCLRGFYFLCFLRPCGTRTSRGVHTPPAAHHVKRSSRHIRTHHTQSAQAAIQAAVTEAKCNLPNGIGVVKVSQPQPQPTTSLQSHTATASLQSPNPNPDDVARLVLSPNRTLLHTLSTIRSTLELHAASFSTTGMRENSGHRNGGGAVCIVLCSAV